MLRIGAQNETVRVVVDQRGSPTHAGDLAKALTTIAARFIDDPTQRSGTWHCANTGQTTWHGLACQVFACAKARGLKTPLQVTEITTDEYPTLAKRPADSSLNCSRLKADFGIELRQWELAVEETVYLLSKKEK
jgi:dTDP-4-dehydrorhamnose reductase